MNNINWEEDVYNYDIEVSLFLEALLRTEDKLEISQFGRVIPPEPFFPEV